MGRKNTSLPTQEEAFEEAMGTTQPRRRRPSPAVPPPTDAEPEPSSSTDSQRQHDEQSQSHGGGHHQQDIQQDRLSYPLEEEYPTGVEGPTYSHLDLLPQVEEDQEEVAQAAEAQELLEEAEDPLTSQDREQPNRHLEMLTLTTLGLITKSRPAKFQNGMVTPTC